MGFSAVVAVATAAKAVVDYRSARKARKSAEEQAAKEREALAKLKSKPEPEMPTADSAATERARRRSIAAQLRRRGRQSTILTGGDGGGGGESLGA